MASGVSMSAGGDLGLSRQHAGMTRGSTPAYRATANYTRIECLTAAKFVTRVRGPARFLKFSPPHSRCLLRSGSAHPSVRFLRAIRAQRPKVLSRPDVRSAFWRPQTDRQLHDLEIVQQRERFLAPCDLESEGRARRRIEGPIVPYTKLCESCAGNPGHFQTRKSRLRAQIPIRSSSARWTSNGVLTIQSCRI